MYSFWLLYFLTSVFLVYSIDLPECKTYECPEYEVVEKKEKYEIRKYKPYKLVTIVSKGWPWLLADYFNFRRLFNYIQGANDKKQKIEMTIPVINRYYMANGTREIILDESEMGFFMPKELGGIVPKPTDDEIVIIDFNFTVYAVSFGGWMTTGDIMNHQRTLYAALKADGVKFDENHFVTGSYNHPLKLWDRHNELFYVAA